MAFNFTGSGALFVDELGNLHESSVGTISGFHYSARMVQHPTATFHGSPVREVSCSHKHAAVLTDEGTMYTRGRNEFGELGLGDNDDRETFVLVPPNLFGGEKLRTVTCGFDHTVAVTDSGKVYSFGCGENSLLGLASPHENQSFPRLVDLKPSWEDGGDVEIVMVSAGTSHTMALSRDGKVYVWGQNQYGQLGINDTLSRQTPVKLEPSLFQNDPVVFIAAGPFHSAAVTRNGLLFTWGCNRDGQLGISASQPYQNCHTPQLVTNLQGSPVSTVSCGYQHTLVVAVAGDVWACGNNNWGALGLGVIEHINHTVGQFQRVEVGGEHIMTTAASHMVSALVTESGKVLLSGNVASKALEMPGQNLALASFTVRSLNTLAGKRIGRCHRLESQHALALCMGQHPRLSTRDGAGAVVSPLFTLKEELIGMIARLSISWPGGRAGEEESTVRLLGGGVESGREMKAWPHMKLQRDREEQQPPVQ